MRARARRQAKTDDLIEAILQTRGRLLPYRPEWWVTLIRWFYFHDAPVGAERIAAMSPPFNAREQLERWRPAQIAHERATYAPRPDDSDA